MYTYTHSRNLEHTKDWYQALCLIMACGVLYYSLGSYLRPFSAPDQLAYVFDFYSPLLQLSHSLFAPSDHASPTLYYGLLKFIHGFANHRIWFYRLPNILLSLSTAFATGVVARHFWQGFTGILATLIMVTFVGSYVGAQSIAPQMFAASITALALLCFFMNLQNPSQKPYSLWYGYGLLALSYMAGGLFALLSPLLMALGWLALTRKKWPWHSLRCHSGILLIPATMVLWHFVAPNPQGNWIQGWTPLLNTFKQAHYVPGWRFLLSFMLMFLPFGVFIMNSLWFSKNPLWQAHGATPQHRLLLQLWITAPLIVCILCRPYTALWLTVSAPAMALSLAPYFQCIWQQKDMPNFRIPMQLLLGLSVFILLTLGLMAFYKRFISISTIHSLSVQIITSFLIIATLTGIAALYRRAFVAYFCGLTVLSLLYTLGLTLIYADLQNKPFHLHFPNPLDKPLQQEPITHDKQSAHTSYCPRLTSALLG